MLWLTNVNPTFNKGTLKKMLRFGVGSGGAGVGDDVEKVGRTSAKILVTPLRVSFRNGEKRLFFVPEGSVITHRTSFVCTYLYIFYLYYLIFIFLSIYFTY